MSGLTSLEEFDRRNAEERAQLERELALAHALPTVGRIVTWTGENGWESDGNTRKPDVERSIELAPWIVHGPFRGSRHVAFKAPDSLCGEKGEHVSSQHRKEFVRRYFAALLDTFEPYLVDTIAVKGTYASYVPETWDYEAHKDYADACEIARGLYGIEVSQHSAKLVFNTAVPGIGPLKVSFELRDGYSGAFQTHKLNARPHYDSNRENATVARWTFLVAADVEAVHVWCRANVTRTSHGVPDGYTMEWLYDTRDCMERAIGLQS